MHRFLIRADPIFLMRKYFHLLMTDQVGGPVAAVIRVFLQGLSVLYALYVRAVAAGYEAGIFKRHKLGRPVISVGNITWGGVGKTPLVLCIAQYLKSKNIQPIILTRGYMPRPHGTERSSP